MVKKLVNYFPIIIIFAVWLIFSSQYFIKGQVPFPSTYLLNSFDPWNDYDLYQGPVKNSATPDVITQIYPWKAIVIDTYKNGNFPLWNPYSFSGTPLLANYQSAVLSPLNILYFILPFVDAWSIIILIQPLLASIFMYMFLRSIKRSEYASVIGAISFGFCGFITSWLMYGTLGFAILFLPIALFAIEKFNETKKWQYSLVLSLTIPLSFFSGHFQTSLYFLIFVGIYILFKFLTDRKTNLLLFNILSVSFGILMSFPQLLPSIEFYFNSPRSSNFMINEIIPWSYIFTFLAPDFFGNPVTRNDWFGHYAEWNAYVGVLPLILGFYSLRNKNQYAYFFFIMSLVVLLFAFRSPMQEILTNLKIPVLSTSAGSRIIVLFSFSFAALSAFGFDFLVQDIKKRKWEPISILLGGFVLVFLGIWFLIHQGIYFPIEKLFIALSNMKLPTLFFAFFVTSIAGVLIVRKRILILLLPLVLISIISFDMLRFSLKWTPFEDKKYVYPKLELFENLKVVAPQDRVIASFGLEGSGTLKLPSTEGYDPLYIESYGEFMAGSSDGRYKLPERSVVRFPRVSDNNEMLLNFLGVRYVIHKRSDAENSWAYPVWEAPVDHFRLIAEDEKHQVFDNARVFPRALVSGKYKVIEGKKETIKEVYKESTDLKAEVILNQKPILDIKESIDPKVSLISYSPNLVKIETTNSEDSLLLLTDPYYPGWKAFIDNKETNILRANHAFRAVEVPKGTHVVNFIYSPLSVKLGFIFSILGIMGILGMRLLTRKI